MSTPSLNLVSPPLSRPRKRSSRGLTCARVARMGAVNQMVQAFSAGNRFSACMGIVLGGLPSRRRRANIPPIRLNGLLRRMRCV